ncbi:MAG: shikimate kinase [Clostridia bacterium]|nr:shikimate kinase [Clostridia bacterium]
MKNIVLIGMPGCGKSTVGVVLAKSLGYRFLDSDLLIQEKEGRLLCDIIEQDGLEGFNKIENRVNASIEADRTVIATGGSVIYGQEAMKHLKEIGIIIYIRLPYSEIENRLGNLAKRGVSIREGQTLRDLYEERVPLYEKYADIIIDEDGRSISETALFIKEGAQKYFSEGKYDNKQRQ